MQALEVAEPILALRGFPGAGPLSLPFALEQVAQSWKLYGGEGCSPTLRKRLAEEGREFILAVLRRFGQVRQAFIAGRNPEAPRHSTETPVAARRRFEQHAIKLAGALAVQGYIDYAGSEVGSASSSGGGGNGHPRQGKPAREEGTHPGKQQGVEGGCSVRVHAKAGKVVVVRDGVKQPDYSLDALNVSARKGKGACIAGLVASTWGDSAVRACCSRYGTKGHEGVAGEYHLWKQGAKLSDCRLDGKGRPTKRPRDAGADQDGGHPGPRDAPPAPPPPANDAPDAEGEGGAEPPQGGGWQSRRQGGMPKEVVRPPMCHRRRVAEGWREEGEAVGPEGEGVFSGSRISPA